jgi:predicted HicB family RNase H-like nuclease
LIGRISQDATTALERTTMHPDDQPQPARFNVRLDDKLRSRIEAAAHAARRSMNAEICHRIEQAFVEQRPDEATA